jgi:uncharacterized protein YydD (DUF2326 family)
MMFLKRLYSEPGGLFKHTINKDGIVEFKNGINFIFGKKDSENDATESLNGIGKSLLLDLLDFCLLSSFDKRRNSRLYEAKEFLKGYKIVLEFEIEGVTYMIRRSVDNPSKIEFGELNNVTNFETVSDLGQVLCDLIFKVPDYPGYYESNLLRKLLPFFIKIHKPKEGRFTDPVEYLKGCYPTELNQYHLYLLGIDNSLAHENFIIQTGLNEKKPALKEIERVVKGKYDLGKISDIDSEIDNLNREIKRLDRVLETFKIADQYKDAERQANELTEALYILNEKKKRKAELEGNINLYKDISKEKAKLITRESQLQEKILDYIEDIKERISEFREIFVKIYNNTYPEMKDRSIFNISYDFQTQQKISIEVRMPAMRSEGKNQGRTLIYDLAVLLHAAKKNLKCPRFLVHDGIFDSMDKAHFVAIVSLLNSMSRSGRKFQYLLPINE